MTKYADSNMPSIYGVPTDPGYTEPGMPDIMNANVAALKKMEAAQHTKGQPVNLDTSAQAGAVANEAPKNPQYYVIRVNANKELQMMFGPSFDLNGLRAYQADDEGCFIWEQHGNKILYYWSLAGRSWVNLPDTPTGITPGRPDVQNEPTILVK